MVRQRLEQQRVVKVVDDVPATPGQTLHGRDRQLLRHDGVERLDEAPEAPVTQILRPYETHTGQVLVGLVRDHQGDVESIGELQRELPVPNSRPGHRAAHRLVGHEKDAGHGLRG